MNLTKYLGYPSDKVTIGQDLEDILHKKKLNNYSNTSKSIWI